MVFPEKAAAPTFLHTAIIVQFYIFDLLNSLARCQLGLVYLHLAIDSTFLEIGRSVNTHVVQATTQTPQLPSRLIGDALASFLSRGDPSLMATSTPAHNQIQPWNKRLDYRLSSSV